MRKQGIVRLEKFLSGILQRPLLKGEGAFHEMLLGTLFGSGRQRALSRMQNPYGGAFARARLTQLRIDADGLFGAMVEVTEEQLKAIGARVFGKATRRVVRVKGVVRANKGEGN